MKKVVVACDSFKETFSSIKVNELIKEELEKKYDYQFKVIPIADGGEGTISVLEYQNIVKIITKEVIGPNRENITGLIGIFNDNTAIIECANVVGFQYKSDYSTPGNTTSYGIGELIKYCINLGIKMVYVALGGTITNDCGIGLLEALGAKFYDKNNNLIDTIGDNLIKIKKVDITNLIKVDIVLLSDVTNPLYGKNGASYVYARQKGATDKQIKKLDEGLINFSKVTNNLLNKDCSNLAGAGSAGGIGYALMSYLDATYSSGINQLLDLIDFEKEIKNADLIITGEGKIDKQSLCGKAISGIISRANKYKVKVIGICGLIDGNKEELKKLGLEEIYNVLDVPKPIEEIKNTCEKDLRELLNKINI